MTVHKYPFMPTRMADVSASTAADPVAQEGMGTMATQSGVGGIVQAVGHVQSGPISRFVADLALTVKKLGGDSHVISNGGRFVQELTRAGLTHQTIDFTSGGPLGGGGSGQISKWANQWNASLIHSHGAVPAQRVAKALNKRPIRHVSSLYRLPDDPTGKDAGSKAILSADHVIVASQFLKQMLGGDDPVKLDKISVIPPGLAINAVHPSVVTASRLSRLVKMVDLPTDAPMILFPAALQPNAGHKVLMDVLEGLGDAPWVCVLATIGPSNPRVRQQLQTRIEKAGLQQRIRFVENCDDPATLYKLSTVVISSITGNLAFDYAAAEAQSAGRLVLVPNSGASVHQVQAGEDGAVYETADAETLGLALRWALSLPMDTKAAIEHAATARAYKSYKKDEVIKRVFAVYDALLA